MANGRRLVNQWARWCERHPAGHLGYGKNPIVGLMDHGIRVGIVHYHDEPEVDDTMQRVDAAIIRLHDDTPAVWASLMARHRQVIGGSVRLGAWAGGIGRPFTATEIAEQLAEHLGEPRERALQRLGDRCAQGYRVVAQALESREKITA